MIMKKKFICFLDILGFKDLVYKNKQSDLINIFKQFNFAFVLSLSDTIKETIELENKIVIPNFENIKTSSLIVSDSIIIWTEDDSIYSLVDLIKKVGAVLKHSFYIGLPLRGAITHGDFYYEKTMLPTDTTNEFQMLVGKSLVIAYESEKKQEWAGCILDVSCNDILESKLLNEQKNAMQTLLEYLTIKNYLIEYHVAVKKEGKNNLQTVNWVDKIVLGILNMKQIKNHFAMHNKSIEEDSVIKKINNTEEYIRYVQKENREIFIGMRVF